MKWLAVFGPGLLIAATGVGAGDLATGALAGSKLGTVVLWAVVLGAFIKFVLNEGLARWQLSTGETLLEGTMRRLPQWVSWAFLAYLLWWSYQVGSALMSACGVAAHALVPIVDAGTDKIIYGFAHSALAVALVLLGGYRLFGRIMAVCIAVMFVTVVACAIAIGIDGDFLTGLLIPTIPDAEGLTWTMALMGGVGGTVTVMCYGYWIREEGRESIDEIKACRLDLAAGYLMTAIFGLAIVVLGSQIVAGGKGSQLVVNLGNALDDSLGSFAKWAFLLGAWGAVFSSLLGVWQAVPYLFADWLRIEQRRGEAELTREPVNTAGRGYRGYLFAIATVPAVGLFLKFEQVQKVYAIVGALFMPLLAAALLTLNLRHAPDRKNHWMTNAFLIAVILFFVAYGILEFQRKYL